MILTSLHNKNFINRQEILKDTVKRYINLNEFQQERILNQASDEAKPSGFSHQFLY